MRNLITAAILGSLAAPAFANSDQVPAQSATADSRLNQLETVVITARKEQPATHKVDARTAALLAQIAKEKKEKDE